MKPKNIIVIAVTMFIFIAGVSFFMYGGAVKDWFVLNRRQATLPPAISYEEAISGISQENTVSEENTPDDSKPKDIEPTLTSLPLRVNLDVPFTSQAPFANWDEVHEETCEEASIMMVARYKSGRTIISAEDTERELMELIALQNKLFGYYKDTTAEETARIAEEYYGFQKTRVVYEFTVDTIKRELAAGNPVIIPAAGKELDNPYFTPPGPDYHMLVIRGYTADGNFITNDPGTRRGGGFLYDYDTLMAAINNWNGKDDLSGNKVIIVLE